MKATAILRFALLGALAAAKARAWDFTDELDTPSPAPAGNSSVNDEQRIYGGTEADASLYKYIVSLRKTAEGSTYCGGSLIAPLYVITAAHCIKETGTMYASIGSAFATGTTEGERIAVAEYYVHPKYDKAKHLYDVAILKLSTKSAVTPVPLASADGSDNKENTMAVVRGWGMTETKVPASTLQEVNVRIITNAECNKQYSNRITDGMLCAGEGGGKDSCQGDSGGPLVSNDKLVGVVSWGGECGAAAGVYTRVSYVLDFINEKIGGGAATNATKDATPAPATTAPVTTAPTPVVTLATLSPTPVPDVTVATVAPTPVVTVTPTPIATVAPTPVATLATLSPTTAPSTEYPADASASSTGGDDDASAGGDDKDVTVPTVPASTPAAATDAPTTSTPTTTAPTTTAPVTKPTSKPSSSADGCTIKNKSEKQKEKEAKRAAKKLAREEKKKAKEAAKAAKEAEKAAKEGEKGGSTKSNGGSVDLGNDPTQSY